MTTFYSYKKMREFLEYVIDWNSIISTEISEERIELQKKITISEIHETVEAVKQNNIKETIDGIGDILVTYGYLIYLQHNLGETNINTDFLDIVESVKFTEHDFDDISFSLLLDELETEVEMHQGIMYSMCEFLAYSIYMFGEEEIENYLDRILKSNDSKFIKESDWDEEAELAYVNEKYAGKFENITYTESEFRGEKVYLIRADNGRGKLLKPRCFVEP